MTIREIENMPAAEIKRRRDELIAAAMEFPQAELASRYVQARLDAKLRDELLAVQGRKITALEASQAKE